MYRICSENLDRIWNRAALPLVFLLRRNIMTDAWQVFIQTLWYYLMRFQIAYWQTAKADISLQLWSKIRDLSSSEDHQNMPWASPHVEIIFLYNKSAPVRLLVPEENRWSFVTYSCYVKYVWLIINRAPLEMIRCTLDMSVKYLCQYLLICRWTTWSQIGAIAPTVSSYQTSY